MNSNYASVKSNISETWRGGYKVEIDYSSIGNTTSNDDAWEIHLDGMEGNIRDAYGLEIIEQNDTSLIVAPPENYWKDNIDSWSGVLIVDNDRTPGSFEVNQHKTMGMSVEQELGWDISEDLTNDAYSLGFENYQDGRDFDYQAQAQELDVDFSTDLGEFGEITDDSSNDGDNSLAITYPHDEQTNVGAAWDIDPSKEYYLSYSVKFNQGFDFDGDKLSGGKLPGLGTGDLASGGNKPDGTNGFTARQMWREGGKGVLYLYHMDQPDIYGEDFSFTGEDGGDRYFQPGKWHEITQRVEINDGNQANGEIDVWLDSEQVIDLDGLQFVSNGSSVDTLYFSSFFGGNGSDWFPDQTEMAYFDNFVVSPNATDVGL